MRGVPIGKPTVKTHTQTQARTLAHACTEHKLQTNKLIGNYDDNIFSSLLTE